MQLNLDPTSIPWRDTHYSGVFWHPFECPSAPGDRERRKDSVVLIRMDPGCGYPAHRHLGIEDVFILQGGYRDDLGEHHAGSYLRYPAGSTHAPVAIGNRGRTVGEDNPCCILFAIARDGVENL